MSTPSIQTLITQAQQVLNLKSSNEIRATLAAVLANANVGTPLNPNLTTQQLWDEFYEIVRQPSDDIMSIITDQMMRMVFSPPAPGGAGADKQVIFNDGGVLAGDAGLVYNKTTDALTAGNATITGDLTVDTSTLKVDSTNNRVGIGTATPACKLEVVAPAGDNIVSTFRSGDATAANNAGGGFQSISSATAASRVARVWLDADGADLSGGDYFFIQKNGNSGTVEFNQSSNAAMTFLTNGTERYRIASDGVATWSNVGGVAGTAMTLNASGLGIGVTPSAWISSWKAIDINTAGAGLSGTAAITNLTNNCFLNASAQWIYKGSFVASRYQQSGGEHQFYTAVAGTGGLQIGTFTQAMTLDASGHLLVGKTALSSATAGIQLEAVGAVTSTRSAGAAAYFNRLTSDGFLVLIGRESSIVGDISVTTTGTTFNSTSDYRLKEAVQPLVGGLARVSALKPSVYKWKANGSAGEGFLAHELAEVVPAAVTGEKDAVNADGSIKAQSIDMSRVVPILVAAIQELTARLQTLEAR